MQTKEQRQMGSCSGEGQSIERPTQARWLIPAAAVALVYLAFAVYFQILSFEFVDLDVPAQVLNNPHVRGLSAENLKHIFTSTGTTTSYYPIRTLTYAVDYRLWGPRPTGFKLTNLSIHLANVLLVFWLVLRLFRADDVAADSSRPWWDVSAATFAAGMFAVHPLVVEPVVWVAGREELLMTLGALGCVHFHLTARRLESDGGGLRRILVCYVAATLCCLAACLSNAVGATIPLLITAVDALWIPRPKLGKILLGTAALWLIGISTVTIKQVGTQKDLIVEPVNVEQAGVLSSMIEQFGYEDELVLGEPKGLAPERFMLILKVYWLNLKFVLWPSKLGICYEPVTARSFVEADVLLGALALGLTLAALWVFRHRKLIILGILWYGLALAPASHIIPHHIHRADRFLYLPLVGVAVLLGLGLRPLSKFLKTRQAAAGALAAGVSGLLLLDVLAVGQVQTWQNSISMWENCAKVGPDNLTAHRSLARALTQAGQLDRASYHREFVRRKNDRHKAVLNEMAHYLAACQDQRQRDYELAIRLAEWACQLSRPKDLDAVRTLALTYNNYALHLGTTAQFDRAVDYYNKAIRTDPAYAAPVFNLALLLTSCADRNLRRPDEAVRLAKQACRIAKRPDANQLMILAIAYGETGQSELATETTERAIQAAEAGGNKGLAELLRSRLQIYRGGLPSQSIEE